MIKKLINIIKNRFYTIILGLIIIAFLWFWQFACDLNIISKYLLPSPKAIYNAFISSFPELMMHCKVTLYEAFMGLGIGIGIGFVISILMDNFKLIYKLFYPLLIITQTIPVIAIAPLLVVWLGYGASPKIALVVLVCFFPIAIGLLDGFKNADPDAINLLRAMGAGKIQIFKHIKMPYAINGFFASLKISVSYSIVGAVIAEWLGGSEGLGVYMVRVRRSYAIDKMFAVILLIIIISLLLMWLVKISEKLLMPWKAYDKDHK